MNKDIESVTETRKKVVVSFDAEEVAKEEKKILSNFTNRASIPGFRKGKAPVAMIRKRFSKDITTELERGISSKAYEELSSDESIDLYRILDIEVENLSVKDGAKISLEIDTVPTFELPSYSEFSYEKEEAEPTEEELEKAIEHMRTQRADFQIVERSAEKGDYVKCSYEGKLDGKLVAEIVTDKPIYGTQETTWEEAGSEDAPRIQAVADALVGMKTGDEGQATMSYPEDFEVEALAGKEVVYTIKVSEVRAKVLPELNEEFFKTLEVNSLDELKEKTRTEMKGQKEYSSKMKIRRKVSDDFAAAVDFELPLSGVEEIRDVHIQQIMEKKMREGLTQEDLEKDKEALIQEATEAAKSRLKLTLLLDKVAQKEEIQAEKDDFNNAIMQEAYMSQTQPEKLIKELSKDRNRLAQLRGDIIRSKALDHIIDHATAIEAAAATA